MVSTKETRPAAPETQKWSFSADGKPLSLDEFLESYKKQGVFFEGKGQWLKGGAKDSWENFFLVCREELNDFSQQAAKMLVKYCLKISEKGASLIRVRV